jgi:hypothetical protein
VVVFLELYFEFCEFLVGVGVMHHWNQVLYDATVAASFGLGAFTGVSDYIGVDVW